MIMLRVDVSDGASASGRRRIETAADARAVHAEMAKVFATREGPGLILAIQSPRGRPGEWEAKTVRDARKMSSMAAPNYRWQEELLLLHGSRYKVVSDVRFTGSKRGSTPWLAVEEL